MAVQKTLAFERAHRWRERAVLAADWDCTGIPDKEYPFSDGTDKLVAPLAAGGRTVRKFYTSDPNGSLQAVRENHLLPALRNGVALFHFFGHGSERGLGNSWNQPARLLRSADITVANWGKPAIAIVMSCLPNRWQSPYTTTPECILPYGLFVAGSGFVAGIGSTGYLATSDGENLPIDFYADLEKKGTHRLGDLWLQGIRKQASSIPRERLLSVNISGDPTLTFSLIPDPRSIIIVK